MTQSALFQCVKQHVSTAIAAGRYEVGAVLPPADRLARQHQCSVGTVKRALTELADEGVVRRIRRKGTVVSEKPIKGKVQFVLSDDSHTNALFQDAVFHVLSAANYDVELLPGTLESESLIARLQEHGQRRNPQDALIWLSTTVGRPHIRPHYEGRQIAFTYGEAPIGAALDGWVAPDLHRMSQLVVTHLYELGHRSIAVATGGPYEEMSWLSQSARYTRGLAEVMGMRCELLHYHHPIEDLTQVIQQRGVTSYWAVNDHEAMQWETRLLTQGIRTPDDVSIVGRWNTPWGRQAPTPLTTVGVEAKTMAAGILELLGQIKGEKVEPGGHTRHDGWLANRLLQPTLKVSVSTGPARSHSAGQTADTHGSSTTDPPDKSH